MDRPLRARSDREVPAIEGGQPQRGTFLPFFVPSFGEEEEREVLEVLRSGWLTTGPRTARFEEMLRDYTGAAEVVAVSSCTAALHLSLVTLGVGPGDEIVTSPITWPSTANVIVHTGATPVFADVDPVSLNLDPASVEEKVTERTRAILPVHVAGLPADVGRLRAIAEDRGIELVEDAAHALGAEVGGRRVGSLSRFTGFSFYANKTITTGEGGALALGRSEDAAALRTLAAQGVTRDAWERHAAETPLHWECLVPGFKYNLPDLAAAIGVHQLARLDGFLAARGRYARLYREALAETPEIELPPDPHDVRQAYHLFVVRLRPERLSVDRDRFVRALAEEGVATGIHFRGLHLQSFYRDRFGLRPEDLPRATSVSERVFSLPLYPAMRESDVVDVANAVGKLAAWYRAG